MDPADKPTDDEKANRGFTRIFITGVLLLIILLFYLMGMNSVIPADLSAIAQFVVLCVIVVVQVVLRK